MRSVEDAIQHYAIFAQAPLENAFDHFWYACYHYKVKRIIMLCAFEDPYRGVTLTISRNRPKSIGRKLIKP
jgi:protein tyrosine phosphatase